ncbi:MAG: type II secretion system F family protein [Candidatus Hydrogenedentes bacterium]|nr:type II secretion system F family protein [Candidatus Hydrogenedentota bacterium]
MEGTIVAANRREALHRLIERGQHPLDLQEQAERTPRAGFSLQLGGRAIRLATFTRQLATLSASGSPVIKGLAVLAEQSRDPKAKRILGEVTEAVQGGSTFADALAQHPEVFPPLLTSMVRVGEMGGSLDEQLQQLSDLYEKEESLKGEVQAALAYPALVLVLGILSAIILVMFFIPRLESIFETAGEALPTPTRILLAISHFSTDHTVLLIVMFAAAAVGIRVALRSPKVRLAFDRFKLRVPWLGTLVRNLEIARFTRLLGTLTHAGISIVEALRIVQPVLQNQAMAITVREMTSRISTGERLSDLLKQSGIFTPLSVQMVATGEETGYLDQMLVRLAEAYDRETAASTKVMMSLLAPALILFVAAIVGFILVSMILPIFQLSTVMR